MERRSCGSRLSLAVGAAPAMVDTSGNTLNQMVCPAQNKLCGHDTLGVARRAKERLPVHNCRLSAPKSNLAFKPCRIARSLLRRAKGEGGQLNLGTEKQTTAPAAPAPRSGRPA